MRTPHLHSQVWSGSLLTLVKHVITRTEQNRTEQNITLLYGRSRTAGPFVRTNDHRLDLAPECLLSVNCSIFFRYGINVNSKC